MGRQITNQEFITKANVVHNGFYDYSLTTYTRSDEVVIIIDPEYGQFPQIARNHLNGAQHPIRSEAVRRYKRSDADSFVGRAQATEIKTMPGILQGELWDYQECNYINDRKHITLIYKATGERFERIVPETHLMGCLPKALSNNKQKTTKEFIDQVQTIHPDCDFSLVNYINNHTEVTVYDRDHGVFTKKPIKLIKGQGHPNRNPGGFNVYLPGMLYYLRVYAKTGCLYKIGITNKKRVKHRHCGEGRKYKVLKTWDFDLGKDAHTQEQKILAQYKKLRCCGDRLLDNGNTEMFIKDVLGLDK